MEFLNLKINDCHIHIGKSSGIYQTFNIRDIIKFRNAKNIDKMLLFSSDLDTMENDLAIRKLAEVHDFIYGLYWITELAYYPFISDKIVGAKYHGTYLKKPITPNSLLEYLDKEEAIVMVHCGRFREANINSWTSYIHVLHVAEVYPKIKFIMAHMGGTDTTICKRAILDSKGYDNIFFDTSGITTPYILEFAYNAIGADNILFGSDAPWCSFNAMLHTVLDAEIPDNAKINILNQNFTQLICRSAPKMEQ